jgi:hypothetical protein
LHANFHIVGFQLFAPQESSFADYRFPLPRAAAAAARRLPSSRTQGIKSGQNCLAAVARNLLVLNGFTELGILVAVSLRRGQRN